MSETDAESAVRLAQAILDGSLPTLLGCRRICGHIHGLGLAREEPFATFIAVESECDHLPIEPDERLLWNAEVLVQKDREIEGYTEWAREMVITACHAVVDRLA